MLFASTMPRPQWNAGDKEQQEEGKEVCPIIQEFCQKSHFEFFLNPVPGKSSLKGKSCEVFSSVRGKMLDDSASCSQYECKTGA